MIISVINLKGGSGKTTTAMALATAAARHNRNVSVLDTDPQGDATTWAGDAEDAGETRRATRLRSRYPAVHRGLRQYRQTETTAQNHGG